MSPLAVRLLSLSSVAILGFYFFATHFTTVPSIHSAAIKSAKQYAVDVISGNVPTVYRTDSQHIRPQANNKDTLAYVTFSSGTMANESETDINADPYFVATRLLGYQSMHQPETSTQSNIPFSILVTADVPPAKRNRLAADGATVIEVEYVDTPSWVIGEMPQWKDLMTKSRAWQLSQFSRALFLDGDMISNGCLDGVFSDPNTHMIPSREPDEGRGYATVPESYLLATMAEANPVHAYPPHASNGDYKEPGYFNAGFFIFGPSQSAFEYYISLLETEDSFDPRYVEQNSLNYAHRLDGRMPWKQVDTKWNIRFPSVGDREGGVVSMHDKWWSAHMDKGLQPYYDGSRWRMEGFYEAWDEYLRK